MRALAAAILLTGCRDNPQWGSEQLLVGAFISFAVGIVALRWLIGWSHQDRLHWFAWWCIPVGLAAIAHFGFGVGFQ